MNDEQLRGLTVVDAVHEVWSALPRDQKEEVAAECNVGVSTIYQWGERDDRGAPRMKMAADKVEPFCRASRSTLVADVIADRAHRATGRHRARKADPSHADCMKEATDIPAALARALQDGVLTEIEKKRVLKEIRELADVLERTPARDVPAVFQRAASLAEAEGTAP